MFDTKVLKPHISLNVSDVEASIDFYRRMFGIEPAKVRTGYAKFDVETPALNLTLNQVPFVPKGGLSHLGVQVAATEDVLAIRDRWAADGLIPREEMQTTCCYAVQDKAWVRDPDGNEWEAFVVLEDNLPEGMAKSDDAACCVPTFTTIDGSSKEPVIACC
ncbi:MAG: VOC family protein [Acidobacteria bacterium]|nr:VOC family protein [Acidobacteriota bacterium]MCW5948090.1 VOC family protein [Pyrinomonadaceae bacterium]